MEEEQGHPYPGQHIVAHKARTKGFELAFANEQGIETICRHIEAHVGKIDSVFHEHISDLVHIDIHHIKPTPERDWWTLITTGMSDRPMTMPIGVGRSRFAELVICLPSSWPLDQEDLRDEANYWPIRLLKVLSRLPHTYDTWLAPGHTVPNNNPPEPYAPGVGFCCALLLSPMTTPEEFDRLEVTPGKVVEFMGVFPLYREEMDLKLERGTDAILERFAKYGVTEFLLPGRRNVAKRSLWPF